MPHYWKSSDNIGKQTTEVKWNCFFLTLSRIHNINMMYDVDLDHLTDVVFVSFSSIRGVSI